MPGFIIFDSVFSSVCSGAIFSRPPTWWVTSSLTYSGERTARSERRPDEIKIFLTPGIARALRYSEISLLWSVPRLTQIDGYTHDRRRHDSSIFGSLQASRYIL